MFSAGCRWKLSKARWWVVCFGILLLPRVGWAQKSSNWRPYRAVDGLAEAACVSASVTSQGKILVRHLNADFVSELDGYSIKTIPIPEAGSGRVVQGAGGQLWMASSGGVMEYTDGKWQVHYLPEVVADARQRIVRSIDPIPLYPVRQGRIVFLLPDRLMEFSSENPERPRTRQLREANATGLGAFLSLSPEREGGLWISGRRGLAKIPGSLRNLKPETQWTEYIVPDSLGVENLRGVHEWGDGEVLALADTGGSGAKALVHFDGQRWWKETIGLDKVRLAWRGPDKSTWAATVDTLYRRAPGQERFVEREELAARQYFDVAVEPGGAFWLATSDGLFRYAENLWAAPPHSADVVSVVSCMAASPSNGVWFVAGGGLHLSTESRHQEFMFPPQYTRDLQTSRGVFPMQDGGVLMEAAGRLWGFRPEDGSFQPFGQSDSRYSYEVLGGVGSGTFLVQRRAAGVEEPPELFQTSDGQTMEAFETPPPFKQLGGFLTAVFVTHNGDLWMGGVSGVALYRERKWHIFDGSDQSAPEAPLGFLERADGSIWCATRDRVWEFGGKNWAVLKSGFDRVYGFCRTRDDTVWVASNSGVFRIAQGVWVENAVDEGLPSASVREVVEERQGRVWAATSHGVALLNSNSDPDPPQTTILGAGSALVTVPEGATFTVSFGGMDKWKYAARDRLLFSYRLDEVDWTAFYELNSVSFSELAGGKHYFQVRAMDRNCNVETKPARLEFAVIVPWYKEARLLGIAGAGFAVALSFAALAFNRHRRLLRSYAEVEKKVAERTAALEVASRQLLHSQKMTALGTLAAGVAHDFNNILSIIKGSAQIIESHPGDTEKVRVRVDRIKTVVDQGAGIVKAMLGFSRDSGGSDAVCDLNAVIADTVKLLGDRFLREVRVVFTPDLGPLPVNGSSDLVQQILLNFIFNAAEAMTDRKDILVKTTRVDSLPPEFVLAPRPCDTYVAVHVVDFGCGISPENLPRIFDPFFTTKSLSARRGTGLGLSMAYELAKKMGAGLAVTSQAGQGSTFSLILPAADPRPTQENPP